MIHFTCRRCSDVGLVECVQGPIRVLAKCFCLAGKKQPWELPEIPISGFKDYGLDHKQYIAKNEEQKQQLMNWHIERIRTSKEFWDAQLNPDGAR